MDEAGANRLVVIEPIVRRVIQGRVPDAAVDDLVQETLLRLTGPATRMTADELQGYAIVSARNAAASFHRTTGRHRRLQAGLIDFTQPEGPDSVALGKEEAETVRTALAAMDPADRDLLQAHHVDDTAIPTIARQTGRSEMATRLRLSRARARLRVDYTLAREGTDLPTVRCRAVLVALSSGDRRAQARLDADDHLARCEACAALVAPATGQYRPAIGFLPVVAWWWKGLSSAGRRTLSIGSAASVAAGVAVVALAVQADQPAPEAAAPTTTTTAPPTTVAANTPPPAPGKVRVPEGPLPSSPAGMASAAGQTVAATNVSVLAVPTDEGFWIRADDGGRLWVQLVGPSDESPVKVEPQSIVTFTGRLVAHAPRFAGDVGIESGPDASELTAQGHHIEVATNAIRTG